MLGWVFVGQGVFFLVIDQCGSWLSSDVLKVMV